MSDSHIQTPPDSTRSTELAPRIPSSQDTQAHSAISKAISSLQAIPTVAGVANLSVGTLAPNTGTLAIDKDSGDVHLTLTPSVPLTNDGRLIVTVPLTNDSQNRENIVVKGLTLGAGKLDLNLNQQQSTAVISGQIGDVKGSIGIAGKSLVDPNAKTISLSVGAFHAGATVPDTITDSSGVVGVDAGALALKVKGNKDKTSATLQYDAGLAIIDSTLSVNNKTYGEPTASLNISIPTDI